MLGNYLRPVAAIAALAGLAAYATIMLRGPQGLSALTEKRREIRTLEEQNANLQRDIEAKKLRIEKLKPIPQRRSLNWKSSVSCARTIRSSKSLDNISQRIRARATWLTKARSRRLIRRSRAANEQGRTNGFRDQAYGFFFRQQKTMGQPKRVADAGFGDRTRQNPGISTVERRVFIQRMRIKGRGRHAGSGEPAMKLIT